MAVAVLDLDFDRLPRTVIGLERYESALILLRLGGRPVGQALLPVVNGRLGGDDLRAKLFQAADSAFWEAWLRDSLGLNSEQVPSTSLPSATVAVCTRDRTDDLRRCLDALMRLPDDGQEIIVIDNCPSNDATQRLTEQYPRVRYVREERRGLNVARNRALREAKNEIIAFTDDDATPDPSWLRTLLRNFKDDPLVVCVTGLTMALELETESQELFQRYGAFLRGFKRITFDAAWHDPLLGWQAGAGVNMALRCNIVDLVGPFDEALDAGTPTHAGGDSDMFRRILATGFRITYDPEALNWHRHRSRWEELRRQLYGYEVAGFAVWTRSLVFEGNLGALWQAGKWFKRELRNLKRSLRHRPGSMPLDLILARFRGAAVGPWMYFYAYWQARKR